MTDKVKVEECSYRWHRRYVFAAALIAFITLLVVLWFVVLKG
jgi:hypothetical protein